MTVLTIAVRRFVAVSMTLVLTLASGIVLADCTKVRAKVKDIGPLITDPAICNGYDLCQYIRIRGKLNGKWWSYWDRGTAEIVANETGFLLVTDDVFETKKGDIFATGLGITHLAAEDGFGSHFLVNEGTGRYEGATGWMATTLREFPTGGRLIGEICGPNIRGDDNDDDHDADSD